MKIQNMFQKDINRDINGVVKVSQSDQHSLEQEENNALRHQLLERLQASPTSHNYSQRELFNIVYMIVELCGSVCYTSIIEQVPDTIDHIKPLLYTMIRRILNHEPDQTNPDF